MQESNAAIEAYAQMDPRVDFVDIGTAMLGANGLPIPELFVDDGLHMTSAGYDIWDEIVMEALMPGHMHGMHMHGQGAHTKGAHTKGAHTKGADTKGADTRGGRH